MKLHFREIFTIFGEMRNARLAWCQIDFRFFREKTIVGAFKTEKELVGVFSENCETFCEISSTDLFKNIYILKLLYEYEVSWSRVRTCSASVSEVEL